MSRRAHRDPLGAGTGGNRGRALGRERPAGADVVLENTIVELAGDVDAPPVRAHRHAGGEAAGGDRRRALGRERPAGADVVLGDAEAA